MHLKILPIAYPDVVITLNDLLNSANIYQNYVTKKRAQFF